MANFGQLLTILAFLTTVVYISGLCSMNAFPVVINTWPFTNATTAAWNVVYNESGSALDAIETGVSTCEVEQCGGTVGWGGSPDENGETTLDAMIMDGPTHDVGAVGALRRVKSAISVARRVLENTEQTLLVGSQATEFAEKMGFAVESLTSNKSHALWQQWKQNNCQPNFWKNVQPDPKTSCGPYTPFTKDNVTERVSQVNSGNHDTIGMIVIDKQGRIACGTSTNGLSHKIPGRVGDSPIPGSGSYVDQDLGGAAGTGDGDVIMRFLPTYQAVESLRRGLTPTQAAEEAMRRILTKYPDSQAGIVVVDMKGNYGAACINFNSPIFSYSVVNAELGQVTVRNVKCLIN